MASIHPTLLITVEADGATTTDFRHFAGANCLVVSKQLHALLAEYGITTDITGMTPKPELLAASRGPEQVVQQEQMQPEGGC